MCVANSRIDMDFWAVLCEVSLCKQNQFKWAQQRANSWFGSPLINNRHTKRGPVQCRWIGIALLTTVTWMTLIVFILFVTSRSIIDFSVEKQLLWWTWFCTQHAQWVLFFLIHFLLVKWTVISELHADVRYNYTNNRVNFDAFMTWTAFADN